MDLEAILLNEITQTQKGKYCSVCPSFASLDTCLSWNVHSRQEISKGVREGFQGRTVEHRWYGWIKGIVDQEG